MAHQFIPFQTGSDERDHDLASEVPVRRILNGEFRSERGISKRYGFQPAAPFSDSAGEAMLGTTLLGNGLNWGVLRKFDFLPGAFETARTGTNGAVASQANSFRSERAFEVHDGLKLSKPSVGVATVASHQVVCVAAQRGDTDGIVVTVVDPESESVLYRANYAGYELPMVAVASSAFLVFTRVTATNVIDLIHLQVDGSGSVVATTFAGVTAATTNDSVYDACSDGTTALLAFRVNASNDLSVKRFSSAGANTATIAQAVTGAAPHQVSICVDDLGAVHVAHCALAATDTAYLETFNSALGARTLGSTAVFAAITAQDSVAVANLPGSTKLVLVSNALPSATDPTVRHKAIATDHTGLTAEEVINSATAITDPLAIRYGSLAARPFVGLSYWHATTERNYYPTAVLGGIPRGDGLTLDGATASNSGAELSGILWNDSLVVSHLNGKTPTGWASDSATGDHFTAVANVVAYDFDRAVVVGGASGVTVAQSSIAVVRLRTKVDGTSAALGALPTAVLGRTSYVGGALLRFFDGLVLGEVVPTPLQPMTLAAGSGTNLAAGTYSYCAVSVWEDSNGDLHRSAPSPVVSRVHNGTAGIVATLRAHFPSMLDLDCGGQRWRFELYRTEAGGSTFYYQGFATAAPDSTVVFAEDSTTDVALATHRTLYITGGVLPNEPPPALSELCVHQDRLWGISAQDPTYLHCSKVKEVGIAPEFNAALVVHLDEPAVALASCDDKLLVFTRTGARVIVGDGPDALGAGTFAPPEPVVSSLGASGPKAARSIPLGVLVHSPVGFQLIGRDLSAVDVDFLKETWAPTRRIGASYNFAARQQVWFVPERPSTTELVVFDYSRGQLRAYYWSLVPNNLTHLHDLAAVSGTPYVLARASGPDAKLYKLSTTAFDDDDVPVSFEVESGWFAPDGLNGDCRFRAVAVLGEWAGNLADDAVLTLDAYVQRPNESNSVAVNSFAWTGLDLLGNPRLHRRDRLAYQRGCAARAVVSVDPTVDLPDTDGPTLLGVDWDYAVRESPAKQAPSKTSS
jgi:hypothetical protein